jgi:hypothetical protein
MNFIKKIFDGKIDEDVHLQFQKFSKGEFKDRALIRVKQSKGKYTINTSSEFANELVKTMAEKLGNKSTKITGVIVSTSDLKDKLDYTQIKQFQGVKKYFIDKEMSGNEIIKLLEEFPKNFFALSFEVGENKLKIKPKAPKASKAKKGEAPKADFCKLITKDKEIGSSFVVEKSDFKESEINHTFIIEKIIFPENEKDFAKIREIAKKSGKIIRNAIIDEKEFASEKEFEA